MEQRREALTEREAREVILRGIDAQCNKRSPLVYIKAVFAVDRRLEQRREAPTEREAREVILRCKDAPYGTAARSANRARSARGDFARH